MQETEIDTQFVAEITKAQPKMRSYLAKLLANSTAVEDTLQECNRLLWVKRSNWDPSSIFLKWAYRFCYFQAKSHLNKKNRDRLIFQTELLELFAGEYPSSTLSSERNNAMQKCLDKLDPKDRSLLLEKYDGNLTVNQLARRESINPNTLSQKLRRLRHTLHLCIISTLSLNAPV